MLWTWSARRSEGLLCIADVSIEHQHGSLVSISNHGISYLTSCAEAEPGSIPCIVKLQSTQRLGTRHFTHTVQLCSMAHHSAAQHSRAVQSKAQHSAAQRSSGLQRSRVQRNTVQQRTAQQRAGQGRAGQGRAGQTNDHYQEPCLHQASKQRTGVAWANHLFSSSEFEIFTSLVSYLSAIQGRIVVTHTRSQHRIDIYWMTHLNFEGGQGAWGGLGDGVGVASLPL